MPLNRKAKDSLSLTVIHRILTSFHILLTSLNKGELFNCQMLKSCSSKKIITRSVCLPNQQGAIFAKTCRSWLTKTLFNNKYIKKGWHNDSLSVLFFVRRSSKYNLFKTALILKYIQPSIRRRFSGFSKSIDREILKLFFLLVQNNLKILHAKHLLRVN